MFQYVISWGKISRMSQFFHMVLNRPVSMAHSNCEYIMPLSKVLEF